MNKEFSWSAAREARIDRAIDRAVREMMQVDPPPGLRRRVLARLNGVDERRGYLLPRYAFAVMTVVVLVVSFTLMPNRIEPPLPPKAPVMWAAAAVPVVDADKVISESGSTLEGLPTPTARTAVNPPPRAITRETIRMPRVTNVFGKRPNEVSAATIDRSRREIVAAPLTIVPLSARPIVIAPLVVPPPAKGGQ